MGFHNISLPQHFYAQVRERFLYDEDPARTKLIPCVVFGIASTPSRAVGFHILTEHGAMFADIPLHALVHKITAPELPLDFLECWDCFGYDVTAVVFEYLREMSVAVYLKKSQWREGLYVCSLDWIANGFSDTPEQHKVMHLIALDNGCYALQPNNRCRWTDQSFTDNKKWPERPDFQVNTHVYHCEEGENPLA